VARSRKQDIIFSILKAHPRNGENIYGDGVLEILQTASRFLRSADGSYLAGPDDIYVSPSQIRRFTCAPATPSPGSFARRRMASAILRCSRWARSPRLPGKLAQQGVVRKPDTVSSDQALEARAAGNGSTEDLTARTIDLVAADRQGSARSHRLPAKSRQDDVAQNIATAITNNHPEVILIVLLIDERPEEVTEMQRTVKARLCRARSDEPRPATSRWPKWSSRRRSGWWSTRRTLSFCSTPSLVSPAPTTPWCLIGQGADRRC